MKKTKILAAALALAMAALPIAAACEKSGSAGNSALAEFKVNGKAFSLADHALPAAEMRNISAKTLPTKAETKDFVLKTLDGEELFDAVKEDGHHLYDLATDTLGATAYGSISHISNSYYYGRDNGYSYYAIFSLEKTDGSYEYCGPTGKLLTTDAIVGQPRVDHRLIDDGTLFSFEYTTGTDGSSVTKYFSISYDDDRNILWESITEDTWNDPDSEADDYQIGDMFATKKSPLADIEEYPDYLYKNYSYTKEGSAISHYTFYNGDAKTAEATVEMGIMLGTVGKYAYFCTMVPVSTEATKGYNLEITSNYTVTKANIAMSRLNFVDGGKLEAVNESFVLNFSANSPFIPSYNYKTNDFDAAIVSALKPVNGVAISSGYGSSDLGVYTLILDDAGKISLDLSAKNAGTSIYKLSDDKFLCGASIIDGQFNTVATLPSTPYLWAEQDLLSVNGCLVDFTGKVAMIPDADSMVWFDKCLITETTVYAPAFPEGKPLSEAVGSEIDPMYSQMLQFGIAMQCTQAEEAATCTVSLRNALGEKLTAIENLQAVPNIVGMYSYGGKIALCLSAGSEGKTVIMK